jgi:hypothetical protein
MSEHCRGHGIDIRNLLRGGLLVAGLAVLVGGAQAAAPQQKAAPQKTFASPEEAVEALVSAANSADRNAALAILGDARTWLFSGDTAADRATTRRFAASYAEKHAIVREGDKASLTVGNADFPFAFPLIKVGERWKFDTDAGKEELLARRIGENELSAIQVLRAIVDAQIEYASMDRDGDGVLSYARRLASRPGKRDGLYWPVKAGETPSPLGALLARASGEGYKKEAKGPTPYHGYYFRLLEGQGPGASSGALDYVVRGRAIGGFAVVAYPARYANSGVMTFIVNHEGQIYESDLGPKTAEVATKMRRFDPGAGWAKVDLR